MNRYLLCSVVLWAVILLTGCPRPYQVRLYNYSGSAVSSDKFLHDDVLGDGESALLHNVQTGENILFPEVLSLAVDGDDYCYSLASIKTGGYTDRMDSGEITVRLRLSEDGAIYVYNIVESQFSPLRSPGKQPPGYPVLPSNCRGATIRSRV